MNRSVIPLSMSEKKVVLHGGNRVELELTGDKAFILNQTLVTWTHFHDDPLANKRDRLFKNPFSFIVLLKLG